MLEHAVESRKAAPFPYPNSLPGVAPESRWSVCPVLTVWRRQERTSCAGGEGMARDLHQAVTCWWRQRQIRAGTRSIWQAIRQRTALNRKAKCLVVGNISRTEGSKNKSAEKERAWTGLCTAHRSSGEYGEEPARRKEKTDSLCYSCRFLSCSPGVLNHSILLIQHQSLWI